MSADQPALIRCSNCLTLNRIPESKLGSKISCGNCKETLDIPRKPVYVKQDNFDRAVAHWAETLLVEFVAPFCVYCKIFDPVVKKLAEERAGRLKVMQVDIESDAYLAQRFKITKTPTFIVYRNGTELIRVDGPPKDKIDLVKWIDNLIKAPNV
ncbi:MAG TPA: thioredoxin domain-containing protein [Nitrospirota bacterium]|nr:thioredoxin domain-containing protein [Nitrospirota bacterium]